MQRQAAGQCAVFLLFGAGLLTQLLARLDDVAAHVVQELLDLRVLGEVGLEFVHQVACGHGHRVARSLADALLHLAPLAWQLMQHLLQALAQGADHPSQTFTLLRAQLLEAFGRQRLAALHGREGKALGGADQRHALGHGAFAQSLQGAVFALFGFLLDGVQARAVHVALQRRRHGLGQLGHEALHGLAQPAPLAWWQAQRAGAVGIGKVVEIAPVWRSRLGGRMPLQQAPHKAVVVHRRLTGHEQVVALAAHGQGQLDGVHRAGLAEGGVAIGQVGGGVETERGGVAAGGELGRLQRAGRWACGVRGVGVSQGQEPSRRPL